MEVSSTKYNEKIYFNNLDILRFLSVFLVFFAHTYEGWCGWYSKPGFMTINGDHQNFTTLGIYLNEGIKNGLVGVDMFFLISGFLITYLLLVEKEKVGKINIPKFFIRRSLRIWPAYFLLIIMTPWLIYLTDSPQPDYLPNLLFYNNFHAIFLAYTQDAWQYPFSHLWSVCVEEHFYLFWPFIISFIPHKHLTKVLISIILVSIASRCYFYLNNYHLYYHYLHTISRIDVITIGALFAIYYKKNGLQLNASKLTRLVIYLVFLLAYFATNVYDYDNLLAVLFKKYFYCLLIGYGMVNFIFNPKPLFTIPFKKIFNYLGKISYGIYLTSNVVIPIIIKKIMYVYETQNMYLYFFLNFAITISVSIIVYELIEKQILKFKKKFEIIKTS